MKIAVNTRFLLNNKLEGIGWFTCESLKRITRAHPEHTFLFLFDRPYDRRFIFADNVIPKIVHPPARHPLLWYYWFEVAIPRVLKREKVDLFVSPDGFTSLHSPVRTLTVMHDLAFEHYPDDLPYIHRKFYHRYVPQYAQKSTRIVTVSKFSKQDIQQHYGVPPEKIDVVYNGANKGFQPFTSEDKQDIRMKWTGGAPYFLFVGALHPRKNISNLLKAFDRFKKTTGSATKLVIAGRKAWRTQALEQTYHTMTHRNAVIFTGHLTMDRLQEVMGATAGLVYVSRFEGFGLPLVEAMQAEVPVITSNVSAMPEVAGDAALTVPPDDPEAISKAMIRLHNDKSLAKQLVEAGRLQSMQFNWDRTAKLLWESIRKTAGLSVPEPAAV